MTRRWLYLPTFQHVHRSVAAWRYNSTLIQLSMPDVELPAFMPTGNLFGGFGGGDGSSEASSEFDEDEAYGADDTPVRPKRVTPRAVPALNLAGSEPTVKGTGAIRPNPVRLQDPGPETPVMRA